MSRLKKLYLRYWCTKENCGYKLTIKKGLPKTKNGTFIPPCYICPNDDEPLMMEINDIPFLEFSEKDSSDLKIDWIHLHADKNGTINGWLMAVLNHAHHIDQGNPCCEQDTCVTENHNTGEE